MSGQPYLKSLYDEQHSNRAPGEKFWAAAIRNLELKIVYNEDALECLPATGALVIVANHPFGVLDGLIISYLTSKLREDFVVLTNSVLYRAEEIRSHLLPIDFAETKEALSTNLNLAPSPKPISSKAVWPGDFPRRRRIHRTQAVEQTRGLGRRMEKLHRPAHLAAKAPVGTGPTLRTEQPLIPDRQATSA